MGSGSGHRFACIFQVLIMQGDRKKRQTSVPFGLAVSRVLAWSPRLSLYRAPERDAVLPTSAREGTRWCAWWCEWPSRGRGGGALCFDRVARTPRMELCPAVGCGGDVHGSSPKDNSRRVLPPALPSCSRFCPRGWGALSSWERPCPPSGVSLPPLHPFLSPTKATAHRHGQRAGGGKGRRGEATPPAVALPAHPK